jgi:hypothetical protein
MRRIDVIKESIMNIMEVRAATVTQAPVTGAERTSTTPLQAARLINLADRVAYGTAKAHGESEDVAARMRGMLKARNIPTTSSRASSEMPEVSKITDPTTGKATIPMQKQVVGPKGTARTVLRVGAEEAAKGAVEANQARRRIQGGGTFKRGTAEPGDTLAKSRDATLQAAAQSRAISDERRRVADAGERQSFQLP